MIVYIVINTLYTGCESVRSNNTGRPQAVRYARALGVPQRQGLRGGAGQGVRAVHQQQRGDEKVPVVIEVTRAVGALLRHAAQEEHEEHGGRRARGHAQPSHDRVHVHRGQGRLSEVLLQVARQTSRTADLGV